MRHSVEFYLTLSLASLSFVRLLAVFLFPSFPQLYPAACTWISVCIRPVCINALDLRETPSRLGLHNNALSLRETLSRLGLHNNALGLRETPSRLSLHNNALGLRETPSQLGLHNNALSLPVSS